jgi:hypothetical protein
MTYDNWKLATPEDAAEDRERFMRKLNGWRWRPDPDEARDEAEAERLHDIYEDCKADWQLYGEDE